MPRAVGRFLDGVEEGAWLGMEQHFTPTAAADVFGPGGSEHRDGPRAIVHDLHRTWPPGRWRVTRGATASSDDVVIVELEACAIGDATRVRRTVDVFQIDDGRIAMYRSYRWLGTTARAEMPPNQPSEETMSNQNEAIVRRGYEAFGAGDTDTLAQVFAPDIVWSVPGRSQIAGEYKGLEEVFGLFGKVGELSGGTLRLELQTVTARGANEVVTTHRLTAQRGDQTLDIVETEEMTLENGRITRVKETVSDQAANDAFWG